MKHKTECDRNELLEYLPELDYVKNPIDKDGNYGEYDSEWGGYCDSF